MIKPWDIGTILVSWWGFIEEEYYDDEDDEDEEDDDDDEEDDDDVDDDEEDDVDDVDDVDKPMIKPCLFLGGEVADVFPEQLSSHYQVASSNDIQWLQYPHHLTIQVLYPYPSYQG